MIVGPGRNKPLSPACRFFHTEMTNDSRPASSRIPSGPSGLQPVTHSTSIQYTILKEHYKRRIKNETNERGWRGNGCRKIVQGRVVKLAKAAQRQRGTTEILCANKDRIGRSAQILPGQQGTHRQAKRKYYANGDKVLRQAGTAGKTQARSGPQTAERPGREQALKTPTNPEIEKPAPNQQALRNPLGPFLSDLRPSTQAATRSPISVVTRRPPRCRA